MTDLVLCTNEGCPLKAVCYRSVVHHGVLDHQAVERFHISDYGQCEYYVHISLKEWIRTSTEINK